MSKYLIDTAPLAACMLGRPLARSLIAPWVADDAAATSIVVYGEALEYLLNFREFDERKQALQQLLGTVSPLPLTYAILELYAEIRRQLRPPRGPGLIGDIDTLIAATALDHALTVVTTDSDFTRVPGLAVQLIDRNELAAR